MSKKKERNAGDTGTNTIKNPGQTAQRLVNRRTMDLRQMA